MKTLGIFNDENVSSENIGLMRRRKAVRAIIFDDNKQVAIIHSMNNNYYTLPGGGIEDSESTEEALVRECREEVGCSVKIIDEIGCIQEIREKKNTINESYCYTARLVDKSNRDLTADEVTEELEVIWVPVDEGIKLIKSSGNSQNLYHRYYARRDVAFLKRVRN